MRRFKITIENLINQELETRSHYIDRMIERNYPETVTMDVEQKRIFLEENNLSLYCENTNQLKSQIYLCEGEYILDGFEMIVDYDEEEIIIDENII